jgi:Melibiase
VPAVFDLTLDTPLTELRTVGTAGLTAPDKNPGSYLFLTLADPATRRGVVAGWLTADRGSGVLFSSVKAGKVRFKSRLDYGHLLLDPGESAKIETLAIGIFGDGRIGEEDFADALARQYHIGMRPPLAGYCTWYSHPHGGAADEKSIVELAQFAAKQLKPFGFSFVQIDDRWQDGKIRNGPARRFLRANPRGPYPHGMAPVAARLRQLGLRAGLWFLPFGGDYQDPEFKQRQDWFVKFPDGKPFETRWGGTSLDLTRPDVQAYLTKVVRRIHGWGFSYFKMDGLYTGASTEQCYVNDGYRDDHFGANAPFHDPKVTNLEAFRDGLKLLRQAAGPDVFFSGCNVSQNMRTLGGAIGLLDSMRIGPDNGHRWADYRQQIAHNGSGALVTGPIRGSRLYFLNGRVWWNDPDPTYVRESVPLEQARLITSWVALSGDVYLNSDWLPGLPAQRLDIIKRTIRPHGATARPVDYFDTALPRIWLVTDTRQTVRRDVLGLFNWDNHDAEITCSSAKAGLAPAQSYYAFDFWAERPARSFSGAFEYNVPGRSCRVLAVRAAAGHPVLVSTSRHVTQGIVDVKNETWNNLTATLSATSKVIGNDPYELRIAGLQEGVKTWELLSASVSSGDKTAGVIIEPRPGAPGETGWRRVVIHSRQSRAVEWSLRFTHSGT